MDPCLREDCWTNILISTCVAPHDAILASVREDKAQTSPGHRRSMPRHLIYLKRFLLTHARLRGAGLSVYLRKSLIGVLTREPQV